MRGACAPCDQGAGDQPPSQPDPRLKKFWQKYVVKREQPGAADGAGAELEADGELVPAAGAEAGADEAVADDAADAVADVADPAADGAADGELREGEAEADLSSGSSDSECGMMDDGLISEAGGDVAVAHPDSETESMNTEEAADEKEFWEDFHLRRDAKAAVAEVSEVKDEPMEADESSDDHADSDTLVMGECSPEESDESDGEPPAPGPSDPQAFAKAMAADSTKKHSQAIAASKDTMNVPECARPDFWGFPLVETPEKAEAW